MLWQEDSDDQVPPASSSVCDLGFRVRCPQLPVDHAQGLKDALCARLPWLESEPAAAIHSIHGASSGNGWERPQDLENDILHLPARTRLYLRIPVERFDQARVLCDQILDIEGHEMRVGDIQSKPLSPIQTLFARSVTSPHVLDETRFVDHIAGVLAKSGIRVTRMLCGRHHTLNTHNGPVVARSVLVDNVDLGESLVLQQQGIGEELLLGCGIFLPHKSLAAVGEDQG